MSLSSYNPYERYRRKKYQRGRSFLGLALILSFMMIGGYWIGGQQGDPEISVLQDRLRMAEKANESYLSEMTQLRAERQAAQIRFEGVQESYGDFFADGTMKDIFDAIQNQIGQGMTPERIYTAILAARPPTDCSDPQLRRFIVKTPNYDGADSQISLLDNKIRISGEGVSARNENGQPEAWFDSSRQVTLEIAQGEKTTTKSGVLPLIHHAVIGDREFRFRFEAGAKSFVKVTYDSCAYP